MVSFQLHTINMNANCTKGNDEPSTIPIATSPPFQLAAQLKYNKVSSLCNRKKELTRPTVDSLPPPSTWAAAPHAGDVGDIGELRRREAHGNEDLPASSDPTEQGVAAVDLFGTGPLPAGQIPLSKRLVVVPPKGRSMVLLDPTFAEYLGMDCFMVCLNCFSDRT